MAEFSVGVWGFIFYDDEHTGSRHTVVAAVLGCDLHRMFPLPPKLNSDTKFWILRRENRYQSGDFYVFSVSNPFVSGLVFS